MGSGRENAGEGSKTPFISVIVPCYNSERTIGACLEALFESDYSDFEVVVVDDCSKDGSAGVIRGYPCRGIFFDTHKGASAARNTGAREAKGKALFFIDSDCVVQSDTISKAVEAHLRHPEAVVGGTYTPLAHDPGFFNDFQSAFINYSETKFEEPDYVATHAMVVGREVFLSTVGFDEDFMPILEDVEFSHRVRRSGVKLLMEPEIQVRHIFNFNLVRSMKNAIRKSRFWTMYSMGNRDLLGDSGTASIGLKVNTLCLPACTVLLGGSMASGNALLGGGAALLVFAVNLGVNRAFISALIRAGGVSFALKSLAYYVSLYPLAVGAGGLMGALSGDKCIRR